MYEALITTGNRATVPRPVREAMGMKPGDIFVFIPSRQGFRLQVLDAANKRSGSGRHRVAAGTAKHRKE
jgi:bifunctional DNA-binding transcriptional regulator/antitoxin component of YhaV-PrlF toxin-antitoxin module